MSWKMIGTAAVCAAIGVGALMASVTMATGVTFHWLTAWIGVASLWVAAVVILFALPEGWRTGKLHARIASAVILLANPAMGGALVGAFGWHEADALAASLEADGVDVTGEIVEKETYLRTKGEVRTTHHYVSYTYRVGGSAWEGRREVDPALYRGLEKGGPIGPIRVLERDPVVHTIGPPEGAGGTVKWFVWITGALALLGVGIFAYVTAFPESTE